MKKFTINPGIKRKINSAVRFAVQISFFIMLPSAFTTAFSGIKYIFTTIGGGGYIEITSFISVLIALCAFTIIFGRFFCGFACAFGSLGDWVRTIYVKVCRKLKKTPVTINKKLLKYLSLVKYLVLISIILLCFMGLYGKTAGYSPWEVFSMVTAGNLKFSSHVTGVILLILIIMGMAVCERFFCLVLCPMGAVFSMLPVLPLSMLKRNREQCIKGCSACQNKCPSGIGLPDLENGSNQDIRTGDCFMCGKCIDTCPKGNIRLSGFMWKGNEIWFILFRAAILAGLLIFAGI